MKPEKSRKDRKEWQETDSREGNRRSSGAKPDERLAKCTEKPGKRYTHPVCNKGILDALTGVCRGDPQDTMAYLEGMREPDAPEALDITAPEGKQEQREARNGYSRSRKKGI